MNLHEKHREEMQHVLPAFVADHSLHITHADIWDRVKDHFEIALKQK